MPDTTRRVPSRQERALYEVQSHYDLQVVMANLTPEEYSRFQVLLTEAGCPDNLTDRAAILERAKAYVRGQEHADKERGKTAEDHRKELFGER